MNFTRKSFKKSSFTRDQILRVRDPPKIMTSKSQGIIFAIFSCQIVLDLSSCSEAPHLQKTIKPMGWTYKPPSQPEI